MSVQEMINTPGYYYSLAYWLAAFIVTCTNEKRIQGIKRYVTHLIFLAAIVPYIFDDTVIVEYVSVYSLEKKMTENIRTISQKNTV